MGSTLVRLAPRARLGGVIQLTLILIFLTMTNSSLSEAAELSNPHLEMLAGKDWNQWQTDRKVVFIDGFISGSHWVASNSMFPTSMFSDETVRAGAQKLWEKATAEFGKAVDDPKLQLPRQYTAKDIMVYGMFDSYKKNDLYERAIIKVPTQTIVIRLNQLYADSANLNVPISGAIYLAKKITEGASKDDVDTILPYLRGDKPVPPGWIIPVYDKTGKYVKAIEFP
ncbi:MAG: hypothetical protein NW202_06440 [Nitrospira sp.]|nr:hypothetical protein [Nitrospira sp.]